MKQMFKEGIAQPTRKYVWSFHWTSCLFVTDIVVDKWTACMPTICLAPCFPTYSSALVTFENSPFLSFVSQKMGFVSLKPCLTQPSSLTWYKLMKPPE